MSTGFFPRTAVLAAALVALTAVGSAQAQALVGLTSSNQITRFNATTPGTSTSVAITGLLAGERFVGLDLRPSNNTIYGITFSNRIYTVNEFTGAATFVAAMSSAAVTGFQGWGIDFNPVADFAGTASLRLVGSGGGNFGVVTELTFRLHPVKDVFGGPMFFELADAAALLAYFRDFIADAPREYGGFPAFQIAPPLPFVPPERVGEPFIALVSCWTGSVAEGEQIIQGFRDVAAPVAEHVGVMPYPALNSAFDALVPAGLQHYWKAAFVTELTDEAIAAHVEHGSRVPVVNSTMHLYPVNGACHDVAADATAFGHRDAVFAPVIAGMWPDPADNQAHTAWVKDYYAAVAPHSQAGGYVNFASPDDQQRVADNYGAGYSRLREVKRRYDPTNLFHLNQNIVP